MAKSFSLNLAKEELELIARVVDQSLNVQTALAEPTRDKAIDVLSGKRIMRDKGNPKNIVKRRSIRLSATDKRIKKSNWPTQKEKRARLNERTAERRAAGIPSPFVGRVSVLDGDYIPAPREKTLLLKMKKQVADLVGTQTDSISSPLAVVSMSSGGSERCFHTRKGLGVSINLHDDTPALQIVVGTAPLATTDLLAAGRAQAYDRSLAHREPDVDFRRTLFFKAGDVLIT